ncbi:MAG: ankyrin repeat domain-containing protein [Candidatus Thiodiazotropha sp. (ex Troendleina suluensis)]|nr:ankyrin repeat domain-containing protein [Candidatus Thiodiazotropha sp. (ex Troendleina suluensis)]
MSDKYLHLHEHQEPQKIRDKKPEKDFIKRYQDDLRARLGRAMQSEEAVLQQILPTLSQQFLDAVERGNPDTVQIFLDAGIDINYQHPHTGQTALHVAATAQARHAMRVLLATGKCDFLIRDRLGRLASELAYTHGGDPALARLLGNKERKQAEEQGIRLTRRPKKD